MKRSGRFLSIILVFAMLFNLTVFSYADKIEIQEAKSAEATDQEEEDPGGQDEEEEAEEVDLEESIEDGKEDPDPAVELDRKLEEILAEKDLSREVLLSNLLEAKEELKDLGEIEKVQLEKIEEKLKEVEVKLLKLIELRLDQLLEKPEKYSSQDLVDELGKIKDQLDAIGEIENVQLEEIVEKLKEVEAKLLKLIEEKLDQLLENLEEYSAQDLADEILEIKKVLDGIEEIEEADLEGIVSKLEVAEERLIQLAEVEEQAGEDNLGKPIAEGDTNNKSNEIEGKDLFPDDAFREAVVKVHNLPGKDKEGFPITKEEADNLKKDPSDDLQSLKFNNLNIKDTTGINNMYLGTIDLSDNDISNFEYIAPSSFNGIPFNRSPRAINLSNNENLEKVHVLGSLSDFGNLHLDKTNIDISNDIDFQVKFSGNSTARNQLSLINLTKGIPKDFDFNSIGNYTNGKKFLKGEYITLLHLEENNIEDEHKLKFPKNLGQLYMSNNSYTELPDFKENSSLWTIDMADNKLKNVDVNNIGYTGSLDIQIYIKDNKLLNYVDMEGDRIYKFQKGNAKENSQYIFDLNNQLTKDEEGSLKILIENNIKADKIPNLEEIEKELGEDLFNKVDNLYENESLNFKYNKGKNRYEISKKEFIEHFKKYGYNLTDSDFEKYIIENKLDGQIDFKMEQSGWGIFNPKKNEMIYFNKDQRDKIPILSLKYIGREFKRPYYETIKNNLNIYMPINFVKEGYNVKLHANGGKFQDGSETKELNYAYNEKFDLKAAEIPVGKTEILGVTQTEYKNVFKHWNKNKAGNSPYKQSEPEALNENLDLYAKWEEYHIASDFTPEYMQNQEGLTIDQVLNDLQIYGFIDNKMIDKSQLTDLKLEEDLDSILATAGEKKIKLTGKLNGVDLQTLAYINIIGKFKVDFETNGGNLIESQMIQEGEKATKPENPSKANHKFIAWYTDEALGTEFNFDTPVTEDITLYAKWEEDEKVKVEFNTNGGSEIEAQEIYINSLATKPENPTKANYKFIGWYIDEGLKEEFNFETPVTKNTTVYAKWEEDEKVKVEFNTNGGSEIDPQEIYINSLVTKPIDPSKANHKFIGWYIDEALTNEFDFNTEITKNTTLYAKWEENEKVKVEFNTNGGSEIDSQEIYINTVAKKPLDPTRNNHKFIGWYIDEAFSEEFDFKTEITKNTTLYAKWKENEKVKVEFNTNGGSEIDPQEIYINNLATKPENPSKENHKFIGWYIDKDFSEEFDFETKVIENITLYAKWEEDEKVKVEFNTNGGSEIDPQEIYINNLATKPTDPSKANNKFIGWYIDEGLKEEFNFETPVKENITLYAKWEENKKPVEDKFKVIFDANGGKFDDEKDINEIKNIKKGSNLAEENIKTPSKTNYTFKGWYEEDNKDKVYTKEEILELKIVKNTTLYAKWEENKKVTVDFDTNGGSKVKPQVIYINSLAKEPENPTKENNKFIGWYIDEDLEKVFDFKTEITENITLYAKWKEDKKPAEDKYKIIYNANGGKINGEDRLVKEYKKGDKVTKPIDKPSRYGYKFKGWFYEDGNTANFGSGAYRDIELYAKWVRIDSKPEPKPEPETKPDIDGWYEPSRPEEKPEEEKLNKLDHFAYIKGYPDINVKPEGNITREEVATVFYRLLTDRYRASVLSESNKFPDVDGKRWSNKEISTMANANIIEGYEDGSFRPREEITRAEVAAIAARFDKLESGQKSFSDIEGHWAEKYIRSAAEKAWVKGYEDNSFRPNKKMTRAEFVTLVNGVLERKVREENILEGIKHFKDLERTAWYYEAMIEATHSHIHQEKRLEDGSEVWLEIIEDRKY